MNGEKIKLQKVRRCLCVEINKLLSFFTTYFIMFTALYWVNYSS